MHRLLHHVSFRRLRARLLRVLVRLHGQARREWRSGVIGNMPAAVCARDGGDKHIELGARSRAYLGFVSSKSVRKREAHKHIP